MITTTVETIGPQQALQLLAMNSKNFRRPDHRRVDLYAQEMAAGKWKLNGDTIKVGHSILLDGQHRLLAVVRSGVTIQCIVVRGVEEDDGKTIDRGKPRTISQWCVHKGLSNATNIAATAKLCVTYEKGLWSRQHSQTNDVMDSEVFEFIDLNNDYMQLCVRAAGPVKGLLSQSVMAAVLYFGCRPRDPKNVEEAEWFMHALVKGDGLTDDDAALHLRNRLISQKLAAPISPFMKRALLTIAWNKTVSGEPCTAAGLRLRMTGPRTQKAPNTILQVGSQGEIE